MNMAAFSQIPSAILNKNNPPSPISFKNPSNPVLIHADKVKEPTIIAYSTSAKGVRKSDAYVQTEVEAKPSMVTRGTQTTDSFVGMEALYEQYKTKLKCDSMSNFRPVYQLNTNKENPPLKLGLTLPRGVKRKVFYPGEEND